MRDLQALSIPGAGRSGDWRPRRHRSRAELEPIIQAHNALHDPHGHVERMILAQLWKRFFGSEVLAIDGEFFNAVCHAVLKARRGCRRV